MLDVRHAQTSEIARVPAKHWVWAEDTSERTLSPQRVSCVACTVARRDVQSSSLSSHMKALNNERNIVDQDCKRFTVLHTIQWPRHPVTTQRRLSTTTIAWPSCGKLQRNAPQKRTKMHDVALAWCQLQKWDVRCWEDSNHRLEAIQKSVFGVLLNAAQSQQTWSSTLFPRFKNYILAGPKWQPASGILPTDILHLAFYQLSPCIWLSTNWHPGS